MDQAPTVLRAVWKVPLAVRSDWYTMTLSGPRIVNVAVPPVITVAWFTLALSPVLLQV